MSISEKIRKHSIITSLVAGGLMALTVVTSLKDNVHFGSVTFNNPDKNHYVWGLAPTTYIKGEANGNFYTFGLIVGRNFINDSNAVFNGKLEAYGLIAANLADEGAKVSGDLFSTGILTRNFPSGIALGKSAHYNLKEKIVAGENK